MTLLTYIQKNHPAIYAEWLKAKLQHKRDYARKFARDHYLPAKKKSLKP